jgi:hypothetical protein
MKKKTGPNAFQMHLRDRFVEWYGSRYDGYLSFDRRTLFIYNREKGGALARVYKMRNIIIIIKCAFFCWF